MSGLRYKVNINLLIVTILVIISLLSGGCDVINEGKDFIAGRLSSQDEMDEAVEIVDEFFELLMKKDYEEAYEYISNQDKKKKSEQDFISEFSDVTDIVKVEINWVEVKNNIALIGIDIIDSYDGEEKMYKDIEISLVKEEDESWKIVFWD